MLFPESFCKRLKWAIYEWIGSISVDELASNRDLGQQIDAMCKRLRMITT
jgi:hypothetical protein